MNKFSKDFTDNSKNKKTFSRNDVEGSSALKFNSHLNDEKISKSAISIITILGVILVASNLRAPITSVGPLVPYIKSDLGISNTLAGMITTLPLLAFALFSPLVPKLSNKYGIKRTIFVSIIFIGVGVAIRTTFGAAGLFAGTIIMGLAVAVGNVLIPSFIKQEFPDHIGTATGIYTVSMNTFGATASGVSVPIAMKIGWNGSLSIWISLCIIAIVLWIPQLKNSKGETIKTETKAKKVNLWKVPLAWQVSIYMGLQSLIFYSMVAWMPNILMEYGLDSSTSGIMLSVLQISMIPVTFIVSIIAGRKSSQRNLVIIGGICALIGILGILSGNTKFIYLWVIMLGVGGAIMFGLSMMFFNLRTRNADEAARLSGMAQSVGYLLAAFGPIMFGVLHDMTNSWNTPLIALLVLLAICFVSGLGASRNKFVG